MKRIYLIAACTLALANAACSTPKVDMTVPAQAAFAARTAYGIALTAANQYAAMPRCAPKAPVLCSDQGAINVLRTLDATADSTTREAEQAVRSLGKDPDVIKAAVVAATSAVAAFKASAETLTKGK